MEDNAVIHLANGENRHQSNGARRKILMALRREGPLPSRELAEHTGLTIKQARDNACQAKIDGHVAVQRDEETKTVAYKITGKGVEYLSTLWSKAGDDALETSSSSVEAADDGGADEAEPIEYPEISPGESQQKPLYGVDSTTYGFIELCGEDCDAAIARAIETSSTTGQPAVVYRLIKVGETRTEITFSELL